MAISMAQHRIPAQLRFADSAGENTQSDPCLRDVQKKLTKHKFHQKSSSSSAALQAAESGAAVTQDKDVSDLFKKYKIDCTNLSKELDSPWYRQSKPIPREFCSSLLQSRIDPSESFLEEIFRGKSDN